MEPDKKSGGGLALLVKMGKKKEDEASMGKTMASDDAGSPPDSSPDMGAGTSPDGSTDKATMAVDDLADTMNVPVENRDSFRSAFKNALRACMDDTTY